MVFGVILGLSQHPDRIQDKRLVHNRSKRTLIYTGAALNTFVVVDLCLHIIIDADGIRLTCIHTRTGMLYDRAVGTYRYTASALNTFGFINVSLAVYNRNCLLGTCIHTMVRDTSTAGLSNLHTCHRTFVTRDGHNLDNIGIGLISAHCHFQSLIHNGTLFINTAAH